MNCSPKFNLFWKSHLFEGNLNLLKYYLNIDNHMVLKWILNTANYMLWVFPHWGTAIGIVESFLILMKLVAWDSEVPDG